MVSTAVDHGDHPRCHWWILAAFDREQPCTSGASLPQVVLVTRCFKHNCHGGNLISCGRTNQFEAPDTTTRQGIAGADAQAGQQCPREQQRGPGRFSTALGNSSTKWLCLKTT